MSAGPSAGHSRRGLIGPFTARQIALTAGVMVVAAIVLVFVSSPIPTAAPAVPSVGSGFVAVAAATTGLQPGQQAPELAGQVPTDGPSMLPAAGVLVVGGLLLLAGLALARRGRVGLLLAVFGLLVALVSVPILLAPQPASPVVGLTDLDGKPVRLADFHGHPIWINFFATWCPPCQQETPTLEKLYREHQAEGLVVLAISVQETAADDVRAYAARYGLTFPIGFDATSAVFKAYQAYGLPTQLFIDRQGVIRSVVRGPVSDLTGEQNLAPILSLGSSSGGTSAPTPTASASP